MIYEQYTVIPRDCVLKTQIWGKEAVLRADLYFGFLSKFNRKGGEERKLKSIFMKPEPLFSKSCSWHESRGTPKYKSQGYRSPPRNTTPGSEILAKANAKIWFRELEKLKPGKISPHSPWHPSPSSKTENNVWPKVKITVIRDSEPLKNSLQRHDFCPPPPLPTPVPSGKGNPNSM